MRTFKNARVQEVAEQYANYNDKLKYLRRIAVLQNGAGPRAVNLKTTHGMHRSGARIK